MCPSHTPSPPNQTSKISTQSLLPIPAAWTHDPPHSAITFVRSRGAIYTSREYCALARAWIKALEDPITVSEQQFLDFPRKAAGFFSQLKPPTTETRALESIKSRIKLIEKECVKFPSCFSVVRRSKRTGKSEEDIFRFPTALYDGVKINTATDYCCKSFNFSSTPGKVCVTIRKFWQVHREWITDPAKKLRANQNLVPSCWRTKLFRRAHHLLENLQIVLSHAASPKSNPNGGSAAEEDKTGRSCSTAPEITQWGLGPA